MAAGLASDRSGLVSLLIDDFANPYKLFILEHLTRSLRVNGWDSILVNTRDDSDASNALLNASQRRVDAAVLIGSRFDDQVLATALGARRWCASSSCSHGCPAIRTRSRICCDDRAAIGIITDHGVQSRISPPHLRRRPANKVGAPAAQRDLPEPLVTGPWSGS